ncbi:MAG: DMT family transporter [Pseudomonadota bacterium]
MTEAGTLPVQSPLRAATYMLASAALIALSTLAAKAAQVEAGLHPLQVSHARFLFALLGLLLPLALLRPRFTRIHWGLHITRTTCGWAGATLMFAAAAMIPLSDATALSFLNPVFALILTILILGERPGRWRWAATFIALTGAMVLMRPPFVSGAALELGAVLAISAAAIMGLEITIIKKLTGLERPLQMLTVNNAIGLVIASVAVSFVWQWPAASALPYLAGVGLAMVAAQTCFIQAMRRAEASFVAPFSFTTLIFATAYDFAVYAQVPDAVSWAGIAIIVTGAGLLAWREGARG